MATDIGRSALCESEKWRNRSMMRCEGNRFILFFFCAFVHCRNWFSNTEFDVRKFDVWCSNWLERWMKIKRSLAGRRNHAGLEAGVDRVKSIYCLLADCKNRISKIRSLVVEYIGKVNLYGESWIYYLYVLFMSEIYEHIFENTIFKFENTIFKFEFWQIHAKV